MDIDGQIKLGHLFFIERKCRHCKKDKVLLEDFYRIRRGVSASSYSYECKECTKQRIIQTRKNKRDNDVWGYPDW